MSSFSENLLDINNDTIQFTIKDQIFMDIFVIEIREKTDSEKK